MRIVAELSVVAARERDMIIDLAGLEFIDSSGLAALARVRKQARHAGGTCCSRPRGGRFFGCLA